MDIAVYIAEYIALYISVYSNISKMIEVNRSKHHRILSLFEMLLILNVHGILKKDSIKNLLVLYNLENISFVVSKDIVKRNLNKNFLKANVIFSDDATYKISDYHLRNDLIRNKNSILFKYSNIFKTKNKNEYFFSFIYICGRLCGGQYFICFNLDKDGNLNEYSIRFVEA